MTTSISKKKPIYKVFPKLHNYLKHYNREMEIPLSYDDLMRYENSVPVYDRDGKDTLWESVYFSQSDREHISKSLTRIYTLLKADGDESILDHLFMDRVDYCTFGNSNPFRIRIVNSYNDNFDYFYIKQADASRIYGLELEHILSPNRINYFVYDQTLIEEHIAGIPGDQFIKYNLNARGVNEIRLAKEFIKFNERCFIRLLGDMRSYNYVIDITPDFEEVHYRIRAIDFDQQSHEGKKTLYLPQYFKENNPIVELCIKHMNRETVHQYQLEERTMIAKRIKAARYMLKDLLDIMIRDGLSIPKKVDTLKHQLADHYESAAFLKAQTMGELVKTSLKEMLRRNEVQLNKMRRPN